MVEAFEGFGRTEGPRIERALRRILPARNAVPRDVHAAMHYMIFPGGKRIRPLMVLLAHRTCGGRFRGIFEVAATLELIHTFSLIHDDLPCMDDDDFRRGRPSCHRAFGESTAVLAGDALLVQAFQVLSRAGSRRGGRLVELVAEAIGTRGVIGGQSLDLGSEGREISRSLLATIHRRKTAALFVACLRIGAVLAEAPRWRLDQLGGFGERFGLAFQVADDLLNLEGDFAALGRPRGSDAAHRKATYPRIIGREKTYAYLQRLVTGAVREACELGRWGRVYQGLVLKAVRRIPGWTPAMERGIS